MENITKIDPNAISTFLRQPENLTQFIDMMGPAGKSYVQSVIIAVTASADLMACTPPSILRAALRAASLQLSCDPSLRQAYLIPRNRKIKAANGVPEHWVKEAVFQPHYNGLYNLATRTGKYWVINVNPVYEGSEVYEDTLTGLHTVVLENGLVTGNEQVSRLRKVSDKIGKKVIGYLGYFKTTRGAEKSVYMTIDEIEDRAKTYSDSYANAGSLWKNPNHRPTMQMKTVLIALLKWADLAGLQDSQLHQAILADENGEIEMETDEVTGTFEEVDEFAGAPQDKPEPEFTPAETLTDAPAMSKEELDYLDACEITAADGTKYKARSDKDLSWVVKNPKSAPDKVRAATIILEWRKTHPQQ